MNEDHKMYLIKFYGSETLNSLLTIIDTIIDHEKSMNNKKNWEPTEILIYFDKIFQT